MSQTEPVAEAKPKKHFLLHPAVMIAEAVLLICIMVGIYAANSPGKDHYVGTATVDKVLGGGKKCWVDLTTIDGKKLKNFRMSQDSCDMISEGDTIEVVKGKYVPEIAPRGY